ncbi:beta strand repeat-containing protein, partial [Glaesserella sp.]|uniref:beta strand repeat-containing protein n=1 Tax=Glaesserella sp. TaxID=2094731 RepID=UPI00359FE7F0
MNKIYKVIWNAATGTFVVVSELSKSKTKTKSKQLNTVKTTLFTVSALASAVLGAGQAIAAVAVGSNDSNNFAITTGAVASGTNSVAVGENSNSSGNEATAVGTSANASGYQSTALGMLSNATMNQATAIGAKSNATGIQSTALGVSANATGNQAIALGSNASASNSQSMALGVNANATGDQSTAIGSNAVVNSVKGIAIGYNANATGGQTANIAIGENTTAGASGAVVLGINASADSDSYSAISIGTNATTQFKDAVAIGTNTIAKEASSIAIGSNTKANDKSQAVAIGYTANSSGYQAVALGSNASTATNAGSSLAFGTNATTRAANSIAIGRDAETGLSSGTVTDGAHAVAIGINAKAQKINSIAIGNGSTVTNENATAIGVSSVASGIQATALGALSNAEADQSVAIGRGAKTNSTVAADGARSGGGIAIGRDANASGAGANAMGINAVAVSHGIAIGTNANVAGASSISIGTGSNSSGINSVSVGARAKSLGDNTVAVGQASNASGKSAVAVGDGANSSNNQTVAVGTSSKASAQGATAFGDSTNASGINSLALGIASKASQENTVSIGASADASKANAIALGAASTTLTDATKETQAIIGGITYDGFATRATVATGDQVSVGAAGSERQIKHVAAGNISETSTDAINGSQLYIIAKGLQEKLTHFYSVNNINSASGNYNNDGATGVDALAAGVGTVAAGEEASAVGKSANASGNFSVAFGNTAKALNRNSVAIGSNANSSNDYAIAIGLDTVSSGNGGVAIGSGSSSTQDKAVALGNDAKAQQANATAIGANAKALNTNATALGALANASGISAIAVGENANANSTHSIAIGRTATVNERQDGIAIGTNVVSGLVANDSVYSVAGASRTGDGTDRLKSSVAIGYNAKALGDESVSLGINTHAVGNSAVAIGESAKALSLDNIAIGNDALTGLGTNETAIGSYSRAAGGYSTAIGTRAAATGIQSVAVGGTSAYAKGQQAAALNAYAYAGAKASNALGYHTVVTNNAHSSTALGTASVVSGAYSGVWNASIHKNAAQYVDTDRSFVGGNASYAIGNQNIIGNTSSDTFILGNNVKLGASAATLNTANITGTQNNISTRDHTGVVYSGVTNVTGAVALGSNTGVSVAKGVALGYDSKATTDKGVAGYDPLTQASSSDTSATWKSTSGAVAVGDVASSITRQITGVAAGTADTDAVNVAQLKAISSSAPQGMNVGADQGVVNKDTNLVQHQFSKALSILAGNATFDETSSTNLLTTVLQSEAGNTDIVIRMKDIPTFKGITLTNGSNTTSLTTTTDGLDVGGDKVTNIANGTADSDAVNLAQLNATNANVTNVTNNVTTLQTEVAKGWNITTAQTGTGNVSGKLDDQINMGETVTIEAGNNINITQSANKVSIATSMDPNFTTVTATNKIAIGTNGPSLSTTGIDAANQKITNVSSAVNDGDAVNYGQLNSTLAASKWTLKTSQDNAGEAQVGEINPNDSVTIDGTGLVKVTHTTEASNVNKIHIGIETQAVSSEDGIAKLNGNSAVNGTTTGTQNGNALVSANDLINAVNSASWTLKEKGTEKDQVKAGDVVDFIDGTGTRVTVTTTNNNVSTVKFDVNISDISSSVAFSTATNTTTATDSNKLATAGDVANVANNISTYLIDKGFALVGNKGGAVSKKLGEQVTVKGTLADATDASAENIRVDNDNGELVIKLAEAPTFKSINLKDATNGTTLTTTAEGLNVGGDKITNVANGTQDSDAVNLAQLNATNTNVTNVTNNVTTLQTDMAAAKNNITTLQTDVAKGWNITTAQTGTGNVSGKLDDQINMGETVTIEAGNNINITQSAGKVSIATSMDPNFTTVTATDKIAIGTNGPSLSTAGIDAANTVISNVTNATVNATSKDAVNGSQLYALANSTAAALGGGSSVNSDGTVTAPSFSITDPTSNTVTNYNNVGGALTALNTAINQPLTFAGNNGSTTQKLGSTLNISGSLASGGSSKNIRTNVTAGKVEILLSENPEFNSLNLTSNGNSVTFTPTAEGVQVAKTDGSAAKISNVANGTADSDAVNLSQLNAKVANSAWKLEGNGSEVATVRAGDAVNIVSGAGTTAVVNMNGSKPTITFNVNNTSLATDSAGKVTAPTGDEADKFVKAGDLATILNTVAWNVTAADGDGELDGVATEEQITAGDKVTYTAGKNIKVKQNGAEFTLSTTDNVSFDTVNATKIVIGNPNGDNTVLSSTVTGLDVGGDKITNIANGTADSDAVNLAQLNATNANVTNVTNNVTTLQTEVAKGWNITTAQTGTGNVSGTLNDQINMGETVTIEAGNNINITQSAGKVSIATSM